MGSVVVAQELQRTGSVVLMHRLNYFKLLRSMWNLSAPKIEPVSPTLQSRFLIIGPPGKPSEFLFQHEKSCRQSNKTHMRLPWWSSS